MPSQVVNLSCKYNSYKEPSDNLKIDTNISKVNLDSVSIKINDFNSENFVEKVQYDDYYVVFKFLHDKAHRFNNINDDYVTFDIFVHTNGDVCLVVYDAIGTGLVGTLKYSVTIDYDTISIDKKIKS